MGEYLQEYIVVSAALILFSLILFGNTLWGGFVWDDRAAIIGNKDVRGESSIYSIFFEHDFWGQVITLSDSHKSYRPLTTLSFRLNHFIHGYSASGYHLGNIIIFAITSVLVFILAKQWIFSRYGPIIAALLFTFHPIHVEAVASLVGRADSLCGLFYIATLITYTNTIRSKHKGSINILFRLIPSIFLSLLACLSKEIGATIYGILIIIELIEHINSTHKNNKSNDPVIKKLLNILLSLKSISYQSVLRITCNISSLLVFLLLRVRLNGQHKIYSWTILENHIALLPSFKDRFLSYAQTNSWYFLKLIFPKYLCFDYGYACIPTIHDILDIRNLLGIMVIVSLLFLVNRSIQYSFRPTILLALCLILVPLLPALNIFFPVGTVLAERLLFIPSIGYCFLVADIFTTDLNYVWKWQYNYLVKCLAVNNNNNKRVKLILHYAPAILFLVPILFLYSIRIITRNIDWNSEIKIYESALLVCPHSVKALNNYAALHMMESYSQEKTIDLTEKVLKLHNSFAMAYTNNALAYISRREYIRSMIMLKKAIDFAPENGKNHGYIASARFSFSESLPNIDYYTQLKLKLLYQAKNDYDSSMTHGFVEPALLHARGSVSLALDEPDAAIHYLKAALHKSAELHSINRNDLTILDDIVPSHTYNQLGNALKVAKRYEEAAQAYNEALSMGNIDISICTNLGDLYRKMGKFDLSRTTFKSVMNESNKMLLPLSFYNNYGMLEYDSGNYEEALNLFKLAFDVHETIGSSPNEVSGLESNRQIILNNIKRAQKGIEGKSTV